jgi:hypothetical protein
VRHGRRPDRQYLFCEFRGIRGSVFCSFGKPPGKICCSTANHGFAVVIDMHMHVYDNPFMRTTIEIDTEHRAELLRLAAKRGLKGFSHIIREAVDKYLRNESEKEEKVQSAISLQGWLSESEAKSLRDRTAELRGLWRCS